MKQLTFFIIIIALLSCNSNEIESSTLFQSVSSSLSSVTFNNQLNPTEELNMYVFKNYYNGGGVAIGDVNNDGLQDIYFTGNEVGNKLYLNKGDFKFEDITDKTGLACEKVWSTGASFVDINQDGLLDLYVCKGGPPEIDGVRHNELFINQGDLTFKESSKEYGLDFTGLSVHAVFFDYDKDNDLDCYLLNNSIKSVGGYDLVKDKRLIASKNGNKLLQNDDNVFKDVSKEAGIYNSEIGFGLGVSVGDVNQDGWDDFYVSNDYFEKDYFYINQKDGTFSEQLEEYFSEISLSSMGADIADVNNDLYPDLFVTDMLPESLERYRTSTNFTNWKQFELQEKQGYFRQYIRNSLQLNQQGLYFQEVSRYAGVAATDWSWGALIFDMNNDGHKDVFVANGIGKDLTDQDYVNFYANKELVLNNLKKSGNTLIKTLMNEMPSKKLRDYAFVNNGAKIPQFNNQAEKLGLSKETFSNGSAYADLDNDGDLDLVINHVNDEASIYKNQSNNHFVKFDLKTTENQTALGAKVTIYSGQIKQYQEIAPYRGFQSCVDTRLNFGLGQSTTIDSVIINWPNQSISKQFNLPVDSIYSFLQPDQSTIQQTVEANKQFFSKKQFETLPAHFENNSKAFDKNYLSHCNQSSEGPRVTQIKTNSNKLVYYMTGSKGFPGRFLTKQSDGSFVPSFHPLITLSSAGEEVNAHSFDANGDGLSDLYLCYGSDEFQSNSRFLQDILLLQTATGDWVKSPTQFSQFATSIAISEDIDQDGDLDLFVAPRSGPKYATTQQKPEVWLNNGQGEFQKDDNWTKNINYHGFITDAIFEDMDGDKTNELIIVGEWGNPTIYKINNTEISQKSNIELSGLWNRLFIYDVDNDGDKDILLGNLGLNNFYKASKQNPLKLYIDDFDKNGEVEQFITFNKDGADYTYTLRDELLTALPYLKKKYLKYEDYQSASIKDMFGDVNAKYTVDELQSGWLENDSDSYKFHPFPPEAQLFPIFAMSSNPTKNKEVLLGGNYSDCKPQLGSHLAGKGVVLNFINGNFQPLEPKVSGLILKNEVRDFKWFNHQGKQSLLVINNQSPIEIFEYNEQ